MDVSDPLNTFGTVFSGRDTYQLIALLTRATGAVSDAYCYHTLIECSFL